MRVGLFGAMLCSMAAMLVNGPAAQAQTCEDQNKACLARGHTAAECKASTDKCLQTGRWIGPAGNEYPITKKK